MLKQSCSLFPHRLLYWGIKAYEGYMPGKSVLSIHWVALQVVSCVSGFLSSLSLFFLPNFYSTCPNLGTKNPSWLNHSGCHPPKVACNIIAIKLHSLGLKKGCSIPSGTMINIDSMSPLQIHRGETPLTYICSTASTQILVSRNIKKC